MSFVVHRVTKSAARYTDAGGREKCGYCRFFVPPRSCGKVIGPVSPMGWCKHFSRQMVSQFGGGGSTPVGGGPPGMTLDLNFMSSGNMPAGITFSRASSATYTDSTGTIQTAAINAPRWDHAGGSLRGLLIEEARTNIAQFSEDFSNVAWLKASGGTSSSPVVTANQTVAPDGTTTADRIVYPACSGAGSNSVVGQALGATAAAYTHSIWLRGNVGGERLYLNTTPDGVLYYRAQVTLTTAWQRFNMTTSALSATTWYFQLGCDLRDASQTATSAQTIYAWGAQIEQGAFPTSHIPTTSVSVTRAADVATMPTNVSWYNQSAGSIFSSHYAESRGAVARNTGVWTLDDAAFNRANAIDLIAYDNSTTFIQPNLASTVASVNKGAVAYTNMNVGPGSVVKIACAWGASQMKVSSNGLATQTSALTALPTVTWLHIGNGFGGLQPLQGHMRQLTYWNRALSDTEMQQVTT